MHKWSDHLFAKDYDLASLERITTRRYGFELLVTPRFRHHYVLNVYEALTAQLVRQVARGVRTFIDVGAHYGFYDVLVGLSNPQCRILGFEPVAENMAILRQNLAINNVQASTIQAAVSDAPGRARFQVSMASDNSGIIAVPTVNVAREIDVDLVALDEYVDEVKGGPVLVKIDVDGQEPKVLTGMNRLFEAVDDLRLVIEFNPPCLAAYGHTPQDLLNWLDGMNFDVFFLDDETGAIARCRPDMEWRTHMEGEEVRNLFCIRKKYSLYWCVFCPSPELGDTEQALVQLVGDLTAAHGALCTALVPASGPLAEALADAGASTQIGGYGCWCANEALDQTEIQARMRDAYGAVARLFPALAQGAPDVMVTCSSLIPWGALAAMAAERPHVWWLRRSGPGSDSPQYFYPETEVAEIIGASGIRVVGPEVGIGIPESPGADSVEGTVDFDFLQRRKGAEVSASSRLRELSLDWHLSALQAMDAQRVGIVRKARLEKQERDAQLADVVHDLELEQQHARGLEEELAESEAQVRVKDLLLAELQSSMSYRFARRLQIAISRVFPPGSTRRRLLDQATFRFRARPVPEENA